MTFLATLLVCASLPCTEATAYSVTPLPERQQSMVMCLAYGQQVAAATPLVQVGDVVIVRCGR